MTVAAARAVNQMNTRKEFFFATPAEVREALSEQVGNLLEFTEHAEATEFLQSAGAWPAEVDTPGPRANLTSRKRSRPDRS